MRTKYIYSDVPVDQSAPSLLLCNILCHVNKLLIVFRVMLSALPLLYTGMTVTQKPALNSQMIIFFQIPIKMLEIKKLKK